MIGFWVNVAKLDQVACGDVMNLTKHGIFTGSSFQLIEKKPNKQISSPRLE